MPRKILTVAASIAFLITFSDVAPALAQDQPAATPAEPAATPAEPAATPPDQQPPAKPANAKKPVPAAHLRRVAHRREWYDWYYWPWNWVRYHLPPDHHRKT